MVQKYSNSFKNLRNLLLNKVKKTIFIPFLYLNDILTFLFPYLQFDFALSYCNKKIIKLFCFP